MKQIIANPSLIQEERQPHPLKVIRWRLFILFFPLAGPFLAPLFSAIGIWPFTWIARFVYFLGDVICPLPGRAPFLGGYSTAICPLCYGALLGMTAILLTFPFRPVVRQWWEKVPWGLQLVLRLCAITPWLSDYVLNKAGLLYTPLWMMYLLGLPGGLAVGLLTYFVSNESA